MNTRRLNPSRIADAIDIIDPAFLASPVIAHPVLDEQLGCRVIVKVETLNPIRSFKGRGTDFALATLEKETAERQVVTASAGNFGQGLAYSGAKRGFAVTVYCALNANPLKIDAMRRLGARVVQEGEDFDAAKAAARLFAKNSGATFLEDGAVPEIAEGAGTIALELTRASEQFDTIVLPLGNGALVTGLGAWLKAERPSCKVIGVVAEAAPAMLLSWAGKDVVETSGALTIADGIAVRVPVSYALKSMAETVDEVIAVSEASLVEGMRVAFHTLGLVAEPAGVAGLAALIQHKERFHGSTVATVLCGSNVTLAQFNQWLTGSLEVQS